MVPPGGAEGSQTGGDDGAGLGFGSKVLLLWRFWRLTEEVKNMNMNTVLKVACAALMAAVAAGGAQFLDVGDVSWPAVGSSVLAAVLAYLKKSPLA